MAENNLHQLGRAARRLEARQNAKQRHPRSSIKLSLFIIPIVLIALIILSLAAYILFVRAVVTPGLHFKVGNGSCSGDRSCYGLRKASIVGTNSCLGVEACRQQGTYIQVADFSCWEKESCLALLPNTVVGENSCHGAQSCLCCSGFIPENTPYRDCVCETEFQKRILRDSGLILTDRQKKLQEWSWKGLDPTGGNGTVKMVHVHSKVDEL
mmetsp:Transcript_1676/g.4889  ORF Transcript_1676/g.4889 Transcript_1676/m.4889 type:complete len:211 (-) Transcript_1676:33-665(-)